MKSRRRHHIPMRHYSPNDFKEKIDTQFSRIQDIKYEPQLLVDDNTRLLQLETQGNQYYYNYVYRMKAVDAICASEIPIHAGISSSHFKGMDKAITDNLLDGYEIGLVYGTEVKHKVGADIVNIS
ncbi:putative protein C1orf43 [Galemys pyrenaicus]|uniref:Uncharacterized protein n=1 Tax=Galemys pyrenaicus TaxID=202257 RepID=A0A8J6AJL9_GALPY|nr:putative protein C1orf43 [Galemys pyrenaicus]